MQSNTGSNAILVERRLGSDAYQCGSAFVIITDVLEEGSAEKPPMYLVESLEKTPDADAPTAPDHIRWQMPQPWEIANWRGLGEIQCSRLETHVGSAPKPS